MRQSCLELGLAPAEIQNEEEDDAAKKLDAKIKAKFDAFSVLLLGATQVNGKWYWDSDLTPDRKPIGSPMYWKDMTKPTSFPDFFQLRPGDHDYGTGDCVYLNKNGKIWSTRKCVSKNIMCEAELITAASVNLRNLGPRGSRDYGEL